MSSQTKHGMSKSPDKIGAVKLAGEMHDKIGGRNA
jgi:hypothetical protein